MVARLEAGQAAVVPREIGVIQQGVEITEQGVEVVPLQLEVELLPAGGFVALPAGISVDGIVGIRLDGAEQAGITLAPGGVVGHGEQPLPLDASLGEEGHAPLLVEPLAPALRQRLSLATQGVVADGSFRHAHQDPVPRAGPQVGRDDALLPFHERQFDAHLAGIGGG